MQDSTPRGSCSDVLSFAGVEFWVGVPRSTGWQHGSVHGCSLPVEMRAVH